MNLSIEPKMDPFAKLPAESIWQILKSCCDFISLAGLLKVFPRVNGGFNGSFKDITEHGLRNCSLTSHELHYHFTRPAAVHQTVQTAANIHLTACASLQRFINRLKSAEPRRSMAPVTDVGAWVYRTVPPPKGGELI